VILNDQQIFELSLSTTSPMISPFIGDSVREVRYLADAAGNSFGRKVVSFGLSSFGYDARLGFEFKIFTPTRCAVVDPKAFDPETFEGRTVSRGEALLLPPHSFALGCTVEYIRMPRDVTGLCLNKSTYARCGILCPATVLEAGWEGEVTLEIANTTPLPAKVYPGEGIVQILFFRGEPCGTSYGDRDGKYQGQRGVSPPKV
jgi:dCTP deaminase